MCSKGQNKRSNRNSLSSMKKVFVIDEKNTEKNKDFDPKKYTHLRAYHGARCLDESAYMREGIHTFDKNALADYVKNICRITGVDERKIMEAFDKKLKDETRDDPPRVWLSGTKANLLDGAGHYLIYGSEFVVSVFSDALHDFAALKTVGVPTIFACDIPIEDIGKKWWMPSIVDSIRCGDNNIGFPVDKVLPENIVGIMHPTRIKDPFNGTWYKYKG